MHVMNCPYSTWQVLSLPKSFTFCLRSYGFLRRLPFTGILVLVPFPPEYAAKSVKDPRSKVTVEISIEKPFLIIVYTYSALSAPKP
jgi:hypothetical protein